MYQCKKYSQFYSTLKSLDENSKSFTYNEVRHWLKEVMNYSWRKANTRPPRSLRPGLAEDRAVFKEFILKLIQSKFVIVYIDEWSFNSSSLPLYTWMKKGETATKVIRSTTERYNSIAAQWNNNVYFMLKSDTSNEESVLCFINLLIKQLRLTINKKQMDTRTVFL